MTGHWVIEDETVVEGRPTRLVYYGTEWVESIEQADLGITDEAWEGLAALVEQTEVDG